MVAGFIDLSVVGLALIGRAIAAQYTLSDVYDASNFANKFNFATAKDANMGFVVYQAQDQAISQGLFAIRDNQVYVGADHTTVLQASGSAGRNSLRLESKASYLHGLIVARFTHLPSNACGSWPAFWTLGGDWPNGGEMDLYEGWNDNTRNQPAFHVGSSSQFGPCSLDAAGQTSQILSSNCDNAFQNAGQQFTGQGCTAAENQGPWASSAGGTYAIEWTGRYIKLFNFPRGSEPANLASANPDTASWGVPSVFVKNNLCNIDGHFQAQRLILDIAFCGNPPGTDAFWGQSCAAKTGQARCVDYVARFPGAFSESYFQIQDIRYFAPGGTKSAVIVERAGGNDDEVRTGTNRTGALVPLRPRPTGSAPSRRPGTLNSSEPNPIPPPTSIEHVGFSGSNRNGANTKALIGLLAVFFLNILLR